LKGIDEGPISISQIDVSARLNLDLVLVDFGVGARLLELALPHRSRPFVLDAFLAGRYYYIWAQAKVKESLEVQRHVRGPEILQAAGRETGSIDWADPLIGVRWTVPILECLDLRFRGDVGGFHIASDLAWSVEGLFQYHLPWHPYGVEPAVLLGYKALAFDYETGGDEFDLTLRGPVIGLSVPF
jgi:hypothetical protein